MIGDNRIAPSELLEVGVARSTGPSGREGLSPERRTGWMFGPRLLGLRMAVLMVFLAAWQVASTALNAGFWVSSPLDALTRLAMWTTSGEILFHLAFTLQAAATGFVIGGSAAIVAGLLLGQIPLLAKIADPFIVALYSLPRIALAPLLVLWFGIGIDSKIALAALSVFFLVFFNTYSGVREVDRELIDAIRIMGGRRRHRRGEVIIPSALGWVFSGLRMSVPYALIGAVAGEIVTSDQGLGFLISHSAGMHDTAGVFAALFVLTLVATLLNEAVLRAEARLRAWKSAGQRA